MIIYKTYFYSYGDRFNTAYFKTLKGVEDYQKKCILTHIQRNDKYCWKVDEIEVKE